MLILIVNFGGFFEHEDEDDDEDDSSPRAFSDTLLEIKSDLILIWAATRPELFGGGTRAQYLASYLIFHSRMPPENSGCNCTSRRNCIVSMAGNSTRFQPSFFMVKSAAAPTGIHTSSFL